MRFQRVAVVAYTVALSIGSAVPTSAQGAIRVTPRAVQAEIPVGRNTRGPWRWNQPATPDGDAEYMWSARPEGDSTYSIGFMLFKFPGSTPTQGTFSELLLAGQVNAWRVAGRRESLLPDVRLLVRGVDSLLIVELREPRLMALMFAGKPQFATIITKTPDTESSRRRVAVIYEGF